MMFAELPKPIQQILERVRRRFEKEHQLWPGIFAVVDDQVLDYVMRDFIEFDNSVRDRMEEKLIAAAQMGSKFVASTCEAWALNLEGASQIARDDAMEMSRQQKIRLHEDRMEVVSVMAESMEMHYAIRAPIRRLARTHPRLGPWTILAATKEDSRLPAGHPPPRFNFIYEKAYGGRIYI